MAGILQKIAGVALLAAATAVQAAPVDVIRLNANLTVRTGQQGGQYRQVSLVTKRFINLAMNQATNTPADPNLRLGLTCEDAPRIVVYHKVDNTVEAVLATSSIVQGGTVPGDIVLDSAPFTYTLITFTFNDTDAADDPAVGDVSGIDGGVLQLIHRGRSDDLADCKRAHISTISGWLSYHDVGPRNKQPFTVDPGVVIRGVANAVPPEVTVEE